MPRRCLQAAEKLESELGPIDVWVNDAMVTVFSPFSEITPEEFRRVTEVTYLGFVHGTMAALRLMRPRNRGTIVQVGSALAYRGIPLQAAYCGAKFAIRGFTNSLRTELIHDNSDIHVTMVNLPAVNTPQFDWARTHMQNAAAAGGAGVPAGSGGRRDLQGRARAQARILARPQLGRNHPRQHAGAGVARPLSRAHRVSGPDRPRRKVSANRRDNLMRPVHDLHRTRGSFGREAEARAYALPGPATRVAAATAGLLAVGLIGVAIGRMTSR